MRLLNRTRQFYHAVTAGMSVADYTEVDATLTPEQADLFRRMRIDEQAHSLRVYRALRADGHQNTDLLCAALLHDAGKSRYPLDAIQRVWVVLAEKFMSHNEGIQHTLTGNRWQKARLVGRAHPEWGATLVAEIDGSAPLVELIRRHNDPIMQDPDNEMERLRAVLKAADQKN